MNEWWAYLHENGSIQLKRYWGDPVDLIEAAESPFVTRYTQPFEATSREEALHWAKVELWGSAEL